MVFNSYVVVQDIKDLPFQKLLDCEALKSLAVIQCLVALRCLQCKLGVALSKQLCMKTSAGQICQVKIAGV